jgi:hypothetical protein
MLDSALYRRGCVFELADVGRKEQALSRLFARLVEAVSGNCGRFVHLLWGFGGSSLLEKTCSVSRYVFLIWWKWEDENSFEIVEGRLAKLFC